MFTQLQEMLKSVEARAATRGRPRTRRGAGCHQDGAVAQLAVFVKDAHRFLLSNRSIIEKAPLQIYSSALVFSPTESVVRKKFGRTHIPDWIKLHPSVFSVDGSVLALQSSRGLEVDLLADMRTLHTIDLDGVRGENPLFLLRKTVSLVLEAKMGLWRVSEWTMQRRR